MNPKFNPFKLTSTDFLGLDNPKIKVDVYDSNFFIVDDYIGTTHFHLDDLEQGGTVRLPLEDRKTKESAGFLDVTLLGK